MKEQIKLMNQTQSRSIIPQLHMDRDFCFGIKADFARELIHNGMFAGAPGEARESYQEMRLLTPVEVVQRACDMAEATFTEFEKRGWIHTVPMHDEQIKQLESEAPRATGFK